MPKVETKGVMLVLHRAADSERETLQRQPQGENLNPGDGSVG